MSETFHVVLIKPSRYDADGYPVRWAQPLNSSSTLSCLYGLADDCRKRKIFGDKTGFKIHAFDETFESVDVAGLIKTIKNTGNKAFIGLVGVQSNQFPRAVDLARLFLEHDLPVCIGGFHTSGCMAMLSEMPDDIKDAQSMGISLFAGEAEQGRLDDVFKDAYNGKLQPIYNFMNDLPSIENEPVPQLPPTQIGQFKTENFEPNVSFDLGRGCPFQCSFCSVINVHGRKPRFRGAQDFEKILRPLHANGVGRIFISDDNFARNKNWKMLFNCLIELRENENISFRVVLQVDMLSHKNLLFIEMAIKAGVDTLFVGLETVNADNLVSMKKKQNNIADYRKMLLAWKKYPVVIMAGYILGLPTDTKESIKRDIETVKRELPVDLLTFSYLTPLPGSEDHKNMVNRGEWMDPDMNKYDLTHRVMNHPVMSNKEWEEAYESAWEQFYTPEHMRTVFKRAAALESGLKLTTAAMLLVAKYNYRYFGIHTFDGGVSRVRYIHERRWGLPRESYISFHFKNLKERMIAHVGLAYNYFRLSAYAKRLWKDPNRFKYTDNAISELTRNQE